MLQLLMSPLVKYGVMALIIGGGGLYIKAKIQDIATLRSNNEQLKTVVEQQKDVLKQRDLQYEEVRNAMTRTEEINTALASDLDDLREKFNKRKPDGSKRDVGKLAVAKDKLIEKVINKGTNGVFDCFESLTSNENIDSTTCSNP